MPISQSSSGETMSQPAGGSSILFYDGACGLCQRTVRWMLRHDPQGRLHYAPQQHPLAAAVFARHALKPQQTNSAVLVLHFGQPGESVALRSEAILECLRVLGGAWALLAGIARLVPRTLRDGAYNRLAYNRHRLFAQGDLCALPTAAERTRFLDI
ncbi:MAG TPA: DCC1-like thiol-disulfide oxidoreductase family protein [Acidobacteriaceae bacterium]|nr:DCC1-like thiol-disulfide oxidoreductase family protein [Acidobacteriaceae bacterium]